MPKHSGAHKHFFKKIVTNFKIDTLNYESRKLNIKEAHIDDLIHACKKHDKKAQMEVYNRFSSAMYASAIQIVRNPNDAEDAMQEGFITAFEKIHQYKGNNSFGGWLKKIVLRKSLHYYHHNQRLTHSNDATKELQLVSESDEKIPEQNHFAKLHDALKLLKSRHRIILQLYYLEGFDYEEIGAILNLSYANCRTSLSRAKTELKKLMHE